MITNINETISKNSELGKELMNIEEHNLNELANKFIKNSGKLKDYENFRVITTGCVTYSFTSTETTYTFKASKVSCRKRKGV